MKSHFLVSLAKAIPLSLCVGAFMAPAQSNAQEAPTSGLSIELNAVSSTDAGCRLVFLARNALDVDLHGLVLEAVLFSPTGSVDQLTLLDFQTLPMGRPRVRQFDMPGGGCAQIGSVLINGIATCDAGDLSVDQCMSALRLSSRTEIEVMG